MKTRDRWRTAGLLGEAARNSMRGRELMAVAALAAVFTMTAAVQVHSAWGLAAHLDRLLDRGGATVVLESEAGGVDTASCSQAVDVYGVTAAGWFSRSRPVRSGPVFGRSIPLTSVATSLTPESASPGVGYEGWLPVVLVDRDLVDSMAGEFSRTTAINGTQYAVKESSSLQRLGLPGNYVIPDRDTGGNVAGCILVLDPRWGPDAHSLAAALVGSIGQPPQPVTVSPPTADSPPYAALHDPLVRVAGLLLGAVGSGVAFAVAWGRRSEVAVYRVSGSSRSELSLLAMLEGLLQCAVAALPAVATILITPLPDRPFLQGIQPLALNRLQAAIFATAALVVAIRIVIVLFADPSRALKDR